MDRATSKVIYVLILLHGNVLGQHSLIGVTSPCTRLTWMNVHGIVFQSLVCKLPY